MRTCPSCRNDYADDMDFCPRDATRLVPGYAATQIAVATGLNGRYRVVRKLGAGGMGAVFLAEQVNLGNRPVAIKVLRRSLADDAEFLSRFREEAASTGRIRHQNVVTVYECGQSDDGSPYIAMEYLEGETLRQTLARRGALPAAEAGEILTQAARGLSAAHRLGIIHRDLKPDNLFLTHDDEGRPLVKIVDFGIAKMRESSTHTVTGLTIGTPAYMSVEQASGMRGEELDARSDVYTLGIVAYEMLSGRVPFQADTPLACVRKHLVEAPPPIRAIRPGLVIAPALEQAVMKALAKDREQRYGSVAEFARAFGQAISPIAAVRPEAHALPPKVEPQLDTPVKRQAAAAGGVESRDRSSLWLMGLGGLALFVIALVFFFNFGDAQAPVAAKHVDASPAPIAPQTPAPIVPPPQASASKPTQTEAVPARPANRPVRVTAPSLIRKVTPIYPQLARQARIAGTVKLNAKISKDGRIENLTLISGHPLLVQAAEDAVRQWVYKPTQLNGEPMEVVTTIDVNFTLSDTNTSPSDKKSAGAGESGGLDERTKAVKAAMFVGDLLFRRGEYDKAIAEYDKGLDAEPGNAELKGRVDRAQTAKNAERRLGIGN